MHGGRIITDPPSPFGTRRARLIRPDSLLRADGKSYRFGDARLHRAQRATSSRPPRRVGCRHELRLIGEGAPMMPRHRRWLVSRRTIEVRKLAVNRVMTPTRSPEPRRSEQDPGDCVLKK